MKQHQSLRLQHQRRYRRAMDAGFLWDEVQARMLERMQWVKQAPKQVLVLGDANLRDAGSLQSAYPASELFVVDWAWAAKSATTVEAYDREGLQRSDASKVSASSWAKRLWGRMLAKGPMPGDKPIEPAERRSFIEERSPKLQRIAADGHQLPLQAGVFDLLWSNGLLHWSKQWPELLAELHRCARQDALFSFSLLGVDSLSALRSLTPHLMTFPDMHDLGDALVHTGWAEPVVDMDRIVLTWRHPHDLLSDLRALGGHLNPSQAKHVRSRRWLTDVHQSLEYLRRPDGLFQLEIELILGHAWRAADAKQAAEWQPIQLKLKAS
ncbi:MAG: methyltransferase domain-containing protein [Burkholderiaceae bacterium]